LKLGKKRMRGKRVLDNLLSNLLGLNKVRDRVKVKANRDRVSKEVVGEEGRIEVDQELEEEEEGVVGVGEVLSREVRLQKHDRASEPASGNVRVERG
jgi:chorismate-pyruvate lyase